MTQHRTSSAARLAAAIETARRLTGAEELPRIQAAMDGLLDLAHRGSQAIRRHALEELEDLTASAPDPAVRLKARFALLRFRQRTGGHTVHQFLGNS